MSDSRRKITDLLNCDCFVNGHRFGGHFSGAGNRLVVGVWATDYGVPLKRRMTAIWTSAAPASSSRRRACSVEPGRYDVDSAGQFSQREGSDALRGAPKKTRSAAAAMYLDSERPA